MALPKLDWRSLALYGLVGLGVAAGLYEAVRDAKPAVPSGEPAPVLRAKTLEGAPLTLDSLRGKVVVVDFWATWCAPCKEEMPQLVELEQKHAAKGAVVVAVSMDEGDGRQADVEKFFTELGKRPSTIVFPDPNGLSGWQLSVLPTTYVIGRDGGIVGGHKGFVSIGGIEHELEEALARK